MPEYLSPGVYVEEVASSVKPIAGVSTSTAGFIGVVPDVLFIPLNQTQTKTIASDQVDGTLREFDLDDYPVSIAPGSYQVMVDGKQTDAAILRNANGKSQLVFPVPDRGSSVTGSYQYRDDDNKIQKVENEAVAQAAPGDKATFRLDQSNVVTDQGSYSFQVNGAPVAATLQNPTTSSAKGQVTINPPPTGVAIVVEYNKSQLFRPEPAADSSAAAVGAPDFEGAKLCTNFTEYKNAFGDFSLDPGHRRLTHAVYGFFNNGGTRCYVVRLADEDNIDKALAAFELVDEISIVAAPGIEPQKAHGPLVDHCAKMGDRFAILDGPSTASDLGKLIRIAPDGVMPKRTDYAAFYFPWIKVFDAVAKKFQADLPDGIINVPPSGHLAGIYARVDDERGVHKAPANEAIRGALDVTQRLSKEHQNGLNPKGVNCLRVLNDNILVWGARTVGGDANMDLKYINVRRTLLFLRKSIDEGTQWVVFEPNNPALWQKITRNVTAFLTNVWRSGALFGNTAQEAFYVKCDKETNPQSLIDAGQVVTEIGVAIVRPAEFVIFRISQIAGAGS